MLSNNLSKTYLCGGYLRLSKEDGDVAGSETLQSNSIENQKEYIEDYIHSKPEIKIVDFYVDDGYSGVNFDRPDFQRMLQDILRHCKRPVTTRKKLYRSWKVY